MTDKNTYRGYEYYEIGMGQWTIKKDGVELAHANSEDQALQWIDVEKRKEANK